MRYMYVKATKYCSANCLFLNKGDVFSWLWTAYSNTYVSRSYLETICQRRDHLRKWSSKHQSQWRLLPASHDLRCPRWRVVLKPSLHLTSSPQFSVCILSPVCSLQSAVAILWEEQNFQRKNVYLYQEILFKKWRNLSFIRYMPHKPQTEKCRRSVSLY